ncbi:spore coat protein [Bacillus sp. PS06]|uniref:spore coat protein n=1 Tax=Bacillus sp. PS06 TaxID=2764176 RepID=UPI001786A769|nr:spore coat protein [Bacillus sp. PS06]MBD8067496.1 spore coat protein [Bacillus sp. PS06]
MAEKPKAYRWQALDTKMEHPVTQATESCDTNNDSTVHQEEGQVNKVKQSSEEVIIIKDSCDIEVSTTDTQVAVSLQVALQVAIAIVISISIADSNLAERVTQDLLQSSTIKQGNFQELVIENSRQVRVTTTDTDVAISLQVLIQILIALVVQIDIL